MNSVSPAAGNARANNCMSVSNAWQAAYMHFDFFCLFVCLQLTLQLRISQAGVLEWLHNINALFFFSPGFSI